MAQQALQRSIDVALPSISAPGDSDVFALPRPVAGQGNVLAWTVKPTAITALSCTLQGSLDGVTWVTLDTDSVTTTYGKSIAGQAWQFVKVNVASMTGTKIDVVLFVA